ncbi:MAG: hypothetical protein CMO36_04170 [Verrucomicrobiaceae bacterium]|nr:hypothetical protein [Verrucomicrobiaceae bacterium]
MKILLITDDDACFGEVISTAELFGFDEDQYLDGTDPRYDGAYADNMYIEAISHIESRGIKVLIQDQ